MLDLDLEVRRPSMTLRCALRVSPGERVAVVGPSGAGKTTLLEAAAGLVPLTAGRVVLDGRVLSAGGRRPYRVAPHRRRIGLLGQDPGLFPHLSAGDNLAYAHRGDDQELAGLARDLGVEDVLDRRPARLSGGQAQRLALGRLLASSPGALLLDEPFTGLEPDLRSELGQLVSAAVVDRGIPAVLVTHDLVEAQAFAHRLGVLDAGRMLQLGDPHQVVRRPASRRVAELVGYRGFAAGPEEMLLGVHPARVRPGAHPDQGPVLSGVVTRASPAGGRWRVGLVLAGGTTVEAELDHPPAPGSPLDITLDDPPAFTTDGCLAPAVPGPPATFVHLTAYTRSDPQTSCCDRPSHAPRP